MTCTETYYAASELADALGVTRQGFWSMVDRGDFPPPSWVSAAGAHWRLWEITDALRDRGVRVRHPKGKLSPPRLVKEGPKGV